jgi:hypothetical protein
LKGSLGFALVLAGLSALILPEGLGWESLERGEDHGGLGIGKSATGENALYTKSLLPSEGRRAR